MKRLFLSLICVALWSTMVFGLPGTTVQWKAVWDANTEPDLAGYYLYWKPSGGSYSDNDRINCGLATEQMLTGVVPDNVTLGLTAYDSTGNESEASELFFGEDSTAPGAVGGFKTEKVIP